MKLCALPVVVLVFNLCYAHGVFGGKVLRKVHHIKKKDSLPKPHRNIARSALEGIKLEDLHQVPSQQPSDTKGTKKDVLFANPQPGGNQLRTSQQLNRLSPDEAAAMSSFLKDMDKSHGVLTPDLMKQMARLEEVGPGQREDSQGVVRNLEPSAMSISSSPSLSGLIDNPQTEYQHDPETDTRPFTQTVLPFKLENQNIMKTKEETGEENGRYDKDPLPEYSIQETTFTPMSDMGNRERYNEHSSSEYNYGEGREDFAKPFNDEPQQYSNEELKSKESERVALHQENKDDEDKLIKEIGKKVLMNMLNEKSITSSEIGGSKTQPIGHFADEEQTGRAESLVTESIENKGSQTSTLLHAVNGNNRPLETVIQLSHKDAENIAQQDSVKNPGGISQEPQILLAHKLNGPEKDAAPTPAADVSGKLNKNLQTVSGSETSAVPTTKVYEIVGRTPVEKIKIIIPATSSGKPKQELGIESKPRMEYVKGKENRDKFNYSLKKLSMKDDSMKEDSKNADSTKEYSLNGSSKNTGSKDERDGHDDVVTLKISGGGTPVSFNTDASKDGSIYLQIPKKYSEKFVKSEYSDSQEVKEKKVRKPPHKEDEQEEQEEEDYADVRHLKKKEDNLSDLHGWQIAGKTDTFVRPTEPTTSAPASAQVKASLENSDAVAKSIASLTQALWAGQIARMNQENQKDPGQSSMQSILPFVSTAGNLNVDQMMSLLTHPEELPASQVGATKYEGTSPTSFGLRGKVGRLQSTLKASKLVEDSGITRNKGLNSHEKSIRKQTADQHGWSPCSATCGHGIQGRARPCKGHDCSGYQTESRKCYLRPCADELAQAGFTMHNKFRAWHHSPPLKWSRKLAKKAQKLAESLASSQNDDPSAQELPGENIATIDNDYDVAGEKATTKWYEEVQGFSFQNPRLSEGTRHFSQVVWKGTKKVGIGIAQGSAGKSYVVALYDPPGNVEGQEKENINTPSDAPS